VLWRLEGYAPSSQPPLKSFASPNVLEGRCLQRLRPTSRKDAEPPIEDTPRKELQAAPLQVPAGSALAATTAAVVPRTRNYGAPASPT